MCASLGAFAEGPHHADGAAATAGRTQERRTRRVERHRPQRPQWWAVGVGAQEPCEHGGPGIASRRGRSATARDVDVRRPDRRVRRRSLPTIRGGHAEPAGRLPAPPPSSQLPDREHFPGYHPGGAPAALPSSAHPAEGTVMAPARPRVRARCPAKAAADPPSARWVLTAAEFDVLWEWLRLGATPVVLRMDSPGRTNAARAGIVGRGWQALRERGLADASGPDPGLVRLLNLLAQPAAQLELRMWRGHSMRAVTAARGNSRVLAVRQDETLTVSSCTGLASALIDALPPVAAGPGRAVTVPSVVIDSAATSEALRSVPSLDARMLALVLQGFGARAHSAQICALAVDRCSVLRRLPKIVRVLDTPGGRYQLTRSIADDGAEWTTVAPADALQLRQRTAALLSEAREAAARIG